MQKKDFQNWPHDRLLHEYKQLLKRKKFGLVWEPKPEDVADQCKDSMPILKEEKRRAILTDKNGIYHIFIEGDNYHALSVLNYTHQKKIDVIYIDPPYNTGNKNWKYNNDYVEQDDLWRHSKWLSFMHKRLILAKKLLSQRGFLICAIDANELFSLGLLLDEIFGERNRVGLVTVIHNPKGRNLSKFFSENSEFMLVYAKDISSAVFNDIVIDEDKQATFDKNDEQGKYRLEPFMRIRSSWSRKNKPKCYYPIYVSKDLKELTLNKKPNYHEVYPRTEDGREWAWKNIPETFLKLNKNGYFIAVSENNRINIFHKYREKQVFKNVWTNKKYQSEFHGTNILKKILGECVFEYPKSLYLVADIIKIISKKDSIVLDFFAGSGTTGHAVLDLNKEDHGIRQFILCTNNEDNNGTGTKIATDICYPRIRNVMAGFSRNGVIVPGVGGNLKYYSTEFVGNIKTDSDKRVLTSRSTEMLCLAEATFSEVVIKKELFAIYENEMQMTGIIYDEDAIEDFKKEARKYNKPLVVYVFSYDHTYNEEDFTTLDNLIIVKPIPEVILNVYRKIYKDLYRTRHL